MTATMGPQGPGDRLVYLDILRGIAVMAIFIVNIKGMAMPFAYYSNGSLWPTGLGQDIAIWQKYLVDDRWRTIFSLLYGAGLMLMAERLRNPETGDWDLKILRRRNMWLILFGLIHMFFIWIGDILFLYGVSGLLALGFCKRGTPSLTVWASVFLIIGTAWFSLFFMAPAYSPEFREAMEGLVWSASSEETLAEIAAMQGGVLSQLATRAAGAASTIFFYLVIGGMIPLTMGLMLWGMILFRTGFLTGKMSMVVYVIVAVVGLAGAFGLEHIQVAALNASEYDYGVYAQNTPLQTIDGYFGAIGFSALIALLVKTGGLLAPFAAVGRMAFTNYIASSLIGTTLAGGHAFGLYGNVTHPTLMAIVGASFVAMLVWSPLWLKHFRYGPLEWAWRRLTYGQPIPLRRRPTPSVPA